MDAETKALLAAAAKAKRARTVLLKDMAAWEVGALIDRAEERGLLDTAPIDRKEMAAYLCHGTAEQEAHLTDRLSRAFVWRWKRRGYTKAVFHRSDLEAVFRGFLTTPDKYIKLLDLSQRRLQFSLVRPKWHSTAIKQPTLDELAEYGATPPNSRMEQHQ